jgi:hypothetical protein
MKKLQIMIAVLFCALFVQFVQAQNYAIVHVESDESGLFNYCSDEYDGVIFYAQPGCTYFDWYVDGINYHNVDHVIIDNQGYHSVSYGGCGLQRSYDIENHSSIITNPFTESIIWKRPSDTIRLSIPEDYDFDLEWVWSNGSNDYGIDVINAGIYSITFTSIYGCELEQSTFSVPVYNSVEIYRAGVDPATGYNRLSWFVDPMLVSVYEQVKVLWKGSQVAGYAPYTDGEFLHEGQGSDDQSWNYRLVGVMYDGTECPIPSYQKGTPHANYYPINNNTTLKIDWTPPFIEEGTPSSIDHIEVYKYEPNSQQLIVVSDYVEANAEEVSFPIERFNNGQALLGFVFNDGRDSEEISYTNLSGYFDIDGVGELNTSVFNVYPNPSNGTFTVEGASILTIYNMMGQVIATSYAENGVHTISLSSAGVYFVKSDEGTTQKVVIE